MALSAGSSASIVTSGTTVSPPTCGPGRVASPRWFAGTADVAQLVERDLPKVDVASSNLVIRSDRSKVALPSTAAGTAPVPQPQPRGILQPWTLGAWRQRSCSPPLRSRPAPRTKDGDPAPAVRAGLTGTRGRYGGEPDRGRGHDVADGVGAGAGGGRQHGDHQRHLVPDRRVLRPRLPARRPRPVVRHRGHAPGSAPRSSTRAGPWWSGRTRPRSGPRSPRSPTSGTARSSRSARTAT